MRNIYPKLITTLFIILLAAVIVRYSGPNDKSQHKISNTAQLDQGLTR